jgi:hypothetical protein
MYSDTVFESTNMINYYQNITVSICFICISTLCVRAQVLNNYPKPKELIQTV